MSCNTFSKHLVCPDGAACELEHKIPKGKLGSVLFNQNEVILARLSQLMTRRCSPIGSSSEDEGEKKSEHKTTESHIKEIEVKICQLEKKTDLIINSINAIKEALMSFGTPVLPPLTHLVPDKGEKEQYNTATFTLKGPHSSSFAKEATDPSVGTGLFRYLSKIRNFSPTAFRPETVASGSDEREGSPPTVTEVDVPLNLNQGVDPFSSSSQYLDLPLDLHNRCGICSRQGCGCLSSFKLGSGRRRFSE